MRATAGKPAFAAARQTPPAIGLLRRVEARPEYAETAYDSCTLSRISEHPIARLGTPVARHTYVHRPKRFVYVLRTRDGSKRPYVGVTSNVPERFAAHNRGDSPHTSKYGPWELVVSIEFADERQALEFERYLKSGSGRAFAKRHFA